jgi:hypothetical protein
MKRLSDTQLFIHDTKITTIILSTAVYGKLVKRVMRKKDSSEQDSTVRDETEFLS